MPAAHQVLELRTGRTADHSPETAAQFFATLPPLRDKLVAKLKGETERLSFELVVLNQTIYFLAYVPVRLSEYITSQLQASYPEILVTPLPHDPLLHFVTTPKNEYGFIENQSKYLSAGKLEQTKQPQIPLKTYRDFSDVDPLATVLSTLSKAGEYDKLGIQFVISASGDGWRTAPTKTASESTSLDALVQSKISKTAWTTTIRLACNSFSQERADLQLETMATAFQSITHSEGNNLQLKKVRLRKSSFISQLHTRMPQRLKTPILSVDELATLYHLPNQHLAHIPNIAWGKQLLGEPPENLPVVASEMDQKVKQSINPYSKTTFKNSSVVYGIKQQDRRRHMYVIGKTGTGKSTLLANMAINDLKQGAGMAVIDPHGDLVETLLNYIPKKRINDVIYFDPSDLEQTVKLNLFEGDNVEHRELIASGIVSIFHKLYAYSWGPRLEYILRNALLTLLTAETSKMSDILDLLTNKKFREKILEKLDDPVLRNFWENEFEKMPDRQRTEAIAPILNKVGQFVTSPLVRAVVNAQKSSFSIEEVMDEGKILLVNLSQGKLGEDNATLLGAMLITKIQLAAMGRVHQAEEERRDFYLYVDEFQNFATDSFIKILSEARKYRLNLTLANQYIAQIPEEVQKAIFGNCGTLVSFVMGAEDAEAFSKEFGGHFSKDDLVSLNRYQIVNKLTIDNITSRPFPGYTLPLAASSNKNKEKVIRVSRERYSKKR